MRRVLYNDVVSKFETLILIMHVRVRIYLLVMRYTCLGSWIIGLGLLKLRAESFRVWPRGFRVGLVYVLGYECKRFSFSVRFIYL